MRPRRLFVVIVLVGVTALGVLVALFALVRRSANEGEAPVTESPLDTSTAVPISPRDTDGDGLTDDEEVAAGTDVAQPDTDGDGFTDQQELEAGFDPLGPGRLDRDRDQLPDRDEEKLGSDPRNADTDGDGYLDGIEVGSCHDPRVPSPQDKIAACPPYPGL